MSIALSIVILPSRRLRMALAAFGMAGAVAAVALLAWERSRFHFPHTLALICMSAAVAAWLRAARPGNPRQIDISGVGEIRLSVQLSLGSEVPLGDVMELLPGSTVLFR